MERRALAGLVGGLGGCAFAVGAGMTGSPVLATVAAGCGLLAAGSALLLAERLGAAEQEAAISATELASRREAEAAAAENPPPLLDAETGLPDGRFFDLALDTRVAAARRHLWPVSVVLVELTPHEGISLRETVVAFCGLLRQTLREADIVCRTGPRTFALVLEDTNEAGGVWAAERLQAAVAKEDVGLVRLTAGVAAYPTHGFAAGEVLGRARTALVRASAARNAAGLGAVEVAPTEARERSE